MSKVGSDAGAVDADDRASRRPIGIPDKTTPLKDLELAARETFFPDDPFRPFKNQPRSRRLQLGLNYIFPPLQWLRSYKLSYLKDDIIAGLTIGSLCIPQDIGYSKLAGLPPIYGLFTSFVPPLIYALLGVSREIAIGPVAVVSILLGTLASHQLPVPTLATKKCDTTSLKFINDACTQYRESYLALIFTATFFAGIFQAALGLLRLGFIIDFLSHAAIIGFMAGAAVTIALQQLKGMLGISTASFTRKTDIVSVLRSVFQHVDEWSWRTALLGLFFLGFLLLSKFIGKKNKKLFWIPAIAPLTSVILSTLFVLVTHLDKHGVAIVGKIDGKINPSSVGRFVFHGEILKKALRVGFESALIALTEGIAIGRTFASFNNYQIDGNKEMIAFGTMNIVGSCTSCYVATGSFSRSAVNYNAGCKTPIANVVMSIMVLVVLAVATPLFHNTPNCILASIIINAVLTLIDIPAAITVFKVDKLDFISLLAAFLGVLFISVEIGLLIAVCLSVANILLQVTRPHTAVLGRIPNTSIFRNVEQYPDSSRIPGILIVRIDSAIYFSNANYIRERILRWLDDENDEIKKENGIPFQFLIIEMSPVTNIDTTGILSLEDLLKTLQKRKVQLAFANPGTKVIHKLNDAGFVQAVGNDWFFLTVGEAVEVCRRHITFGHESTTPHVQPFSVESKEPHMRS
ncbi:hypothetical protein KP509_36G062100 [Ceratopteris richardii]|uniref:STAS domain-containing protein n=1 Tax=Ceratopteris richardii TaxID=49495 RepID=A0A8T2QDP7_CERRI|nr:hypothetical protein KP509_36G062100 [Ceratopteris richardii]